MPAGNVTRLLLSWTAVVLSGAAAARAGGWSAGFFNTLYSPVVDPGGVPRTALSPPGLSGGYSSGFGGGYSAGYEPGSTGTSEGLRSRSGFVTRAISRAPPPTSPAGLTSPGSGARLAADATPAGLLGPGLGVAATPGSGTASSVTLRQSFRPPNVVALAEGASKFFTRAFRAFSTSPSETVKFDLFTRLQPRSPTRIYARKNKEIIEQSTFDPRKPTKILIHGFLSHQGPSSGGDTLKNAFLVAQDCNVVTVDWSGADTREYSSAVMFSLPRVASEVAELLRVLASLGQDLNDVHIVGHSLGGQIAGAAGSQMLGPVRVGRITGLDPAGPLFEGKDPAHRLDPSDAAFVDVVHTDGGYLGFAGATGHVDFFPEGGMHVQPGCGKDSVGICSHCLAYDFFIDGVLRPGSSVFRSCSSWQAYQNGECGSGANAVVGIYTDPRSRGSYYLGMNKPVRDALRRAGEKDLVGVFTLRNNPEGKDGVMVLQC